MSDPIYGPERSITFYVAAERVQPATTEAALIVWAALALVIVALTIALGGCS